MPVNEFFEESIFPWFYTLGLCGILFLIGFITWRLYSSYLKRHPEAKPSNYSGSGSRTTTRAEQIGSVGEAVVARHLQYNSVSMCHVINDIIITEGSSSSQIDHVVVNNRGVFVIETKNYKGRIYGSENNTYWTQVLSYGAAKYKIYNPVWQNETHVKKIRKFLNYQVPVYSLVVFVQNNTQYIHADHVIGFCQLNRTIETTGTPNTLTPEQMESIADRLWELKLQNDSLHEQHIQHVQSIKT